MLLAVLAGPRPEQGVAFAIFIVEQVRVDRRVEGGIVELDREVIAALLGAFRPGGPDFRSTHVDAVAGRVLVGAIGLGEDTDALDLQTQGDDLALEIVADLLERTDVSHVTSPVVFRARDHRGLDGDGQAVGDRRRTCPAGRSAVEDAVVATFLPREEWAQAQGKKVAPTALRLRRSRRSRSSARSSHQRGHVRPRAEPQFRQKTWLISV